MVREELHSQDIIEFSDAVKLYSIWVIDIQPLLLSHRIHGLTVKPPTKRRNNRKLVFFTRIMITAVIDACNILCFVLYVMLMTYFTSFTDSITFISHISCLDCQSIQATWPLLPPSTRWLKWREQTVHINISFLLVSQLSKIFWNRDSLSAHTVYISIIFISICITFKYSLLTDCLF